MLPKDVTFRDCLVRERIPLKQGLKLKKWFFHWLEIGVEEEIPLKQGLKHSFGYQVSS